MKKKILFLFAMAVSLTFLLVICIGATDYIPAFGEKIEVLGMSEKSVFGDDGKFDTSTSRVLMNDGITYPSYYIYANSETHSVNFSELNSLTGKKYDRNTVICLEIPEGVKTIPNCFNASGSQIFWGDKYTSTLEYLKLSSTVESMSTDATIFSMKALKCLDMSLSKVVDIPSRGVHGATSLAEIYFPKTLKSIGSTAFQGCSSLSVIDFSGTQLEDIGLRAFFDCHGLEIINLGTNIKRLQTQCFYKAGVSTEKSYIEIYVNNSFEEIYNQYGQILQDAKMAVIYYTGTNTDTGFTVLHSDALKGGASKWATVDAKSIDFDENATYTANTLIYNYNICDAFYGGEHQEDNNPCVINCSNCGTYNVAEKNPIHIEKITIEYVKYDGIGSKILCCTNDGCQYGEVEEVPALFTCLGYSANKFGKKGMTIGFSLNEEAINEFEGVTGKTLKYGVFAVSKENIGDNLIFDKDGNATNGVFKTELTNQKFVAFEIKIVGFEEKQLDIKLAIGAYISVSNEEKTEYSYLQGGGAPLENENYHFVSYNEIINNSNK